MRITGSPLRLVRTAVLLLIAMLFPLSAVAQERTGGAPATPSALLRSAATVTQAVVKNETRLSRSANAARVRAQSTPGTASASFFKTPAGVAVILVMVVGTGYALYSAKHDRITGITR